MSSLQRPYGGDRAAPPTMPGEIPTAQSGWPKVVGIVSIVLGLLGGLTHFFAAVGAALTSKMSGVMAAAIRATATAPGPGSVPGSGPGSGPGSVPGSSAGNQNTQQQAIQDVTTAFEPVMEKWKMPLFAVALLSLACAVALLVAGITTLQRRPLGAMLHKGWSLARLLVALVATYVSYGYHQDIMAAMSKIGAAGGGASGMGSMAGMMSTVGAFSAAFGFLMLAAYPIFVLVWFLRAPVQAEVARWV